MVLCFFDASVNNMPDLSSSAISSSALTCGGIREIALSARLAGRQTTPLRSAIM